MRIGFIYQGTKVGYFMEQFNALKEIKCDNFCISRVGLRQAISEDSELQNQLVANAEIYLYEIASSMCNFHSLKMVKDYLSKRNISLNFYQKKIGNLDLRKENSNLVIDSLAEHEYRIISERTTNSLNEARKKGRVGGRPRISEKVVRKINYLYEFDKHSIKEIARLCSVSEGTVLKYLNREKKT